MKDILITSSVLILALLVLRLVFRNTISRRIQYALWGLVLLRLLMPVSLPALDHNVLAAVQPMNQGVETRLENQMIYALPTEGYPSTLKPGEAPVIDRTVHTNVDGQGNVTDEYYSGGVVVDEKQTTHYLIMWSLEEVLTAVWILGMAGMTIWLLISNVRFWQRLRKTRIPYEIPDCKYPVYLVEEGLLSPCLFGLIHPAIYLTPAAVESRTALRHVIAHETTHAKHLDPLWALLRSICLIIYWFDPLVWVAAIESKTDCELACDEGAMKLLGEEERLAYGRTLLSLIPVRHGTTNPMLSATTMTSDKRHLKDRITRIAEKRQTLAIALFLVVAAVILVCVMTFTGSKEPAVDDPNVKIEQDGTETPSAILHAEELAWFTEEFFAYSISDDNVIRGINIRNQFLSSTYSRPEEIDLFELFYCGTGEDYSMAEEELAQVGAFDTNGEQICPTTKMPVSAMNEVLQTYLGLTLEQTDKVGLDNFAYLEEYDAYYNTHGDTNYRTGLQLAAGERDGNRVRLYYEDTFYGDGWKCITLLDDGDGNYRFLSHLHCEKPNIFVNTIPDEEPWLTIPLAEVSPTDPYTYEVTFEHASDDCAERGGGLRLENDISVRPYLSTDGNVYAAVIRKEAAGRDGMSEWEVDRFFQYPAGTDVDRCRLVPFRDLFGCRGVVVSYHDYITGGPGQGGIIGEIFDYYVLEENENPLLLLRAYEDAAIVDMDGDGENELLSDRQLFYKRDGIIFEVDLADALQIAWPELDYWDFSNINVNLRCLTMSGMANVPEWGIDYAKAWINRDIYFDGENLLVYRNLPETTDHLSVKVPVNFPEYVYTAAKEKGQQAYEATKNGVEGALSDQGFDDWRISHLTPVDAPFAYPGITLEIYSLGYQFHASDPGHVMLAGGTYVQEDGWVGGFYTEESPYLIFWIREDGSRIPLDAYIPSDAGWESVMFEAGLYRTILKNDVCTLDNIDGRALYYMFYENQYVFLNELAAYEEAVSEHALDRLVTYATTEVSPGDADMFQRGLDNLRWNTGTLTDGGLRLYQKLLGLINESNGTTQLFVRNGLRLEVSNVASTRVENMLDDGGNPHEYSVFTCYPGATITVLDADIDEYDYPQWGLYYTGETERTRITDETSTVLINSDLEGVYHLEASLYVLRFEWVE